MPEIVSEFPKRAGNGVDYSDYDKFMDGNVWSFTPEDGRDLGITYHFDYAERVEHYKTAELDTLRSLRSRLTEATRRKHGPRHYRSSIQDGKVFYQFISDEDIEKESLMKRTELC